MPIALYTIEEYVVKERKRDTYWLVFNTVYNDIHAFKKEPTVNEDGSIINGSKANTSSTLIYKTKPEGVYYIADNADGYMKVLYTRFLIKNKKLWK